MSGYGPKARCARCGDTRWCQVTQAYVDHHHPWSALPHPDLPDDAPGNAEVRSNDRRKRAALANSSYPCPDCDPAGFARWAEGHMDAHHDARHCAVCGGKPTKKKEPGIDVPDTPTHYNDPDGPLPPDPRGGRF